VLGRVAQQSTYSLYLYFLGLSIRNTSEALEIFDDEKTSYILLYGIGFKDLVHAIFIEKEKECLHSS
jgi:hypothetical protein